MRKLFTLLCALVLVGEASAQITWRYGENIDAGYGEASVITPYVLFPSKMTTPYQGNSITSVRIGLNREASNISLYIKHNPKDDDYIYRQRIDKLQAGWNEILLDTPYEISADEDIAIGYKATFTEPGGVGYSKESYTDGDYVYNNQKSQWGATGGSICIQAFIEGENMPVNELSMGRVNDYVVAEYEATELTYDCPIRNMGVNHVTETVLNCYIDDVFESAYSFTDIFDLAPNESTTLQVTIPTGEIGRHKVEFVIDLTNGVEDFYSLNNTASSSYLVRDPEFRRKVVCEEGTGTWCGWCPRGMVSLEEMKLRYEGYFLPISIHGNDLLEIDQEVEYNYSKILADFPGFPNCTVDRRVKGDPYSDINHMYSLETGKDSPIKLNLEARWEDGDVIVAEATLTSKETIKNADYNVAFVLLEDAVGGYAQTNYYAGGSNGPMGGWEEKTDPTIDFVYNDLARGIFPNVDGMPMVSNSDLEAMAPVSASYKITIPPTVANKENLHIVAMAINNATTYIDNADSAVPEGVGALTSMELNTNVKIHRCTGGIALESASDRAQCSIFTPDGALVYNSVLQRGLSTVSLSKGVYLVRVKDGNKVLVNKILI